MRLLCFLFLTFIIALRCEGSKSSTSIHRDDFPKEFVFGSGTSAYQVEGAANEDGRSPSVWDISTHTGHARGATGDVASDGYHKYKEDIKLMKETGLEGYRFSISWSRLIPGGRGKINPKGLEFYNNFINELIGHGIQPQVTLLHFDTPQVLDDEYESWISPKIVEDFTAYANVCFKEFGDRVTHWITINEVNALSLGGYDDGILAPNRCSKPFGNCQKGNSVLEPYIVAHHLLLAHSSAASLYKKYYQANQKGIIGLNVLVFNFLPLTNSEEDLAAKNRAFDFYSGWFIEPLVHGDYPKSMRLAAGNKIPKFTEMQSNQLKKSFDFFGVNYYMTLSVKNKPYTAPADQRDITADAGVFIDVFIGSLTQQRKGISKENFMSSATGIQGALEYMKQNYGNPPVYIHENGFAMQSNASLHDTLRVYYISANLESLRDAIRNGSNAKGYFTWSFVDVFEAPAFGPGGFETNFGLYHVDFNDEGRKRSPKFSAKWYSSFLNRRTNDTYIEDGVIHTPQVE